MKTYAFNGENYKDLNSLGLAFIDNFKLACESITNKDFLKFVKQFKSSYKNVCEYLASTRYLQNTLALIIYEFTAKLVIFGQRYDSLQMLCKNIDSKNIQVFASEFGFSKTICRNLDDKKLKADLICFEKNYTNEIAIEYLKEYYKYVTIENTNEINKLLVSSEELFKRSISLFKNKEFLILACHLYSLDEVLKITKSKCPVFDGLSLMEREFSKTSAHKILNNGFYLWILDHLTDYKYYGSLAKDVKKRLKSCKKQLNNSKNDFKKICRIHKQVYLLYLKFVELYKSEKIKIKQNEAYALTNFYCDTYISQDYISHNTVKLDKENNDILVNAKNTISKDMVNCVNSIKEHKGFVGFGMFLAIVLSLYVILGCVLKYLKINVDLFMYEYNNMYLPTIVFGSSVILLLFMLIIVIIKTKKDQNKYSLLAKINFYRYNSNITNEEEMKKIENLFSNEEKLLKSVDKNYPFFGGIANAALAMMISLISYSIIYYYGSDILKMDLTKAFTEPYIYLAVTPSCMCLVFGFLRHKKTFVSHIITIILTVVVAVGLIYLVSAGYVS